jgi:hypothetical protein
MAQRKLTKNDYRKFTRIPSLEDYSIDQSAHMCLMKIALRTIQIY